jgi:hypothetical protein
MGVDCTGNFFRKKAIEKTILRILRPSAFSHSLGHFRKSSWPTPISGLPLKADIQRAGWYVRFVPTTEVAGRPSAPLRRAPVQSGPRGPAIEDGGSWRGIGEVGTAATSAFDRTSVGQSRGCPKHQPRRSYWSFDRSIPAAGLL